MSFIRVRLDDSVKEPEVGPEGLYDLRIVKAEDGESKRGNPMTTVTIRIEGPGDCSQYNIFNHWIIYPTDDTPDGQVRMRTLEIKRFLSCFGIPFGPEGFDSEELVGATGRSLITQEEGDDGIVRNRLRLPRLKD